MDTSNESLSSSDFERLRALIYSESGIHLNADKKTMLEIRLRRRLRSLDMSTCRDYCDYVFGRAGGELTVDNAAFLQRVADLTVREWRRRS